MHVIQLFLMSPKCPSAINSQELSPPGFRLIQVACFPRELLYTGSLFLMISCYCFIVVQLVLSIVCMHHNQVWFNKILCLPWSHFTDFHRQRVLFITFSLLNMDNISLQTKWDLICFWNLLQLLIINFVNLSFGKVSQILSGINI